jgi:hypothetical protein
MKKLAILGFVLVSTAAMAAPGNDNASDKACFGQDRAWFITLGGLTGRAWGDIASDRAGDNASINDAYRTACRAG